MFKSKIYLAQTLNQIQTEIKPNGNINVYLKAKQLAHIYSWILVNEVDALRQKVYEQNERNRLNFT